MAAKRSARPPKAAYRCLAEGLCYPTTRSIRDRIRAGDHMPLEERGEWQRYAVGDESANPPSALIESWLDRGRGEGVEADVGEGGHGEPAAHGEASNRSQVRVGKQPQGPVIGHGGLGDLAVSFRLLELVEVEPG